VFFARSHRLTRTEEQVLNLLCRSMSTPDIAKELDVAVSTVRSHVRSLCIKTGAKGAREMVNRIATLPPVGATPRLEMH
jgi:DNA-binding CsgD family transcriptional regulator